MYIQTSCHAYCLFSIFYEFALTSLQFIHLLCLNHTAPINLLDLLINPPFTPTSRVPIRPQLLSLFPFPSSHPPLTPFLLLPHLFFVPSPIFSSHPIPSHIFHSLLLYSFLHSSPFTSLPLCQYAAWYEATHPWVTADTPRIGILLYRKHVVTGQGNRHSIC